MTDPIVIPGETPSEKTGQAPSQTKNPWPENSDYGKLWRKGYEAGRGDKTREVVEHHLARIIKSYEPKPTRTALAKHKDLMG